MNPEIQIASIITSIGVTLLVAMLIRRRKLREEYSLLWFAAAVVLLVFSIRRRTLDDLAEFVGIAYAPSVLILGIVFFGFILAIHFSVALSRLEEQNKILAQELALLRSSGPGRDPENELQ